MKLDELIAKAGEVYLKHGDVDVMVYDNGIMNDAYAAGALREWGIPSNPIKFLISDVAETFEE